MRRLLNRWLEALGEHIARHGWIDPTGAAAPFSPTVLTDAEDHHTEGRDTQLVG